MPCALAFLVSIAHAQASPVEVAWTQYQEASFEDALRTLASAEERGELGPGTVARALEIRALSAHVLGDRATVEASLRLLAVIDPSYVLGPEAVPVLREELDEYRRGADRVELAVTTERDGDTVVIGAEVTRDPLGAVRRVLVFGRAVPDGELLDAEDVLRVDANGSSAVEYYVAARGLADAVVASDGSAERPLRVDVGDGADEDGDVMWWVLGGAGAALVAAAVVVIALVASAGGDTIVRPTVE